MAPGTDIVLQFDATMDTSIVPAASSFEIKIDSIVRGTDTRTWDDATHLRVATAPGPQPIVDLTIELLVEDPLLHALAGKPVLPFGPETIPAG